MKLEKLRLKHNAVNKEMNIAAKEIAELLDGTFKYNGVLCFVDNYSTDEDFILLGSANGSTISGFENQVSLTFKEFDETFRNYKYKIHFYNGMESLGQVLSLYRTVMVEFDIEPSSEDEIISKGLFQLGTYPKSYTAKVYKVEKYEE